MHVARETIMEALWTLVKGAAGFKTASRRLDFWTKVPDQPAIFMREAAEHYAPREARNLPSKVTLEVEIWIYAKTDGTTPDQGPAYVLNGLIDAVEAALAPDKVTGIQTLGGLVYQCAIEGKIERDPGDIDNQAKAVIPVRIIVPA